MSSLSDFGTRWWGQVGSVLGGPPELRAVQPRFRDEQSSGSEYVVFTKEELHKFLYEWTERYMRFALEQAVPSDYQYCPYDLVEQLIEREKL